MRIFVSIARSSHSANVFRSKTEFSLTEDEDVRAEMNNNWILERKSLKRY